MYKKVSNKTRNIIWNFYHGTILILGTWGFIWSLKFCKLSKKSTSLFLFAFIIISDIILRITMKKMNAIYRESLSTKYIFHPSSRVAFSSQLTLIIMADNFGTIMPSKSLECVKYFQYQPVSNAWGVYVRSFFV